MSRAADEYTTSSDSLQELRLRSMGKYFSQNFGMSTTEPTMATEVPRALGKQGLPGPSRTWRGTASPDDPITSRKY